ncbi:MAG: hypothetical protein ACXWOX_07085 [Ktedonobacteraceae bacterium]
MALKGALLTPILRRTTIGDERNRLWKGLLLSRVVNVGVSFPLFVRVLTGKGVPY